VPPPVVVIIQSGETANVATELEEVRGSSSGYEEGGSPTGEIVSKPEKAVAGTGSEKGRRKVQSEGRQW